MNIFVAINVFINLKYFGNCFVNNFTVICKYISFFLSFFLCAEEAIRASSEEAEV